ncbi:MAG: hypothetical protein GF344_13885 [Chitinivibrionales bacterium]|nr:hypothetical protein [Chitinivibrionales bacterium]MBD3357814.1 hypothetical protein [Chitinivibrionales bacterium]
MILNRKPAIYNDRATIRNAWMSKDPACGTKAAGEGVTTRPKNIGKGPADLKQQEREADGSHTSETVCWPAVVKVKAKHNSK